jgi:hypothetical protein
LIQSLGFPERLGHRNDIMAGIFICIAKTIFGEQGGKANSGRAGLIKLLDKELAKIQQ